MKNLLLILVFIPQLVISQTNVINKLNLLSSKKQSTLLEPNLNVAAKNHSMSKESMNHDVISHSENSLKNQISLKSVQLLDSNLMLSDVHVIFTDTNLSSLEIYGYYSMIPFSQMMPVMFEGTVTNIGNQTQHNVTFNVQVVNSLNISEYVASQSIAELNPGDSYLFQIQSPLFTPAYPDSFTVNSVVSQTETDEDYSDNSISPIPLMCYANQIYARDVSYSTYDSPELYNGYPGDLLGVTYKLINTDTVSSLSVFIDMNSDTGTVVIGQIYLNVNDSFIDDNVVQIESGEYWISQQNLGTWITLPLTAYIIGDDILLSSKLYIAAIEMYYNYPSHLYIGEDLSSVHNFYLESRMRLGVDWFWMPALPMIRMNLSGAILPPSFISYPNTTIVTDTFNYTATVYDPNPNKLIYSIELDNSVSPNWLNIVDNGDNTAKLTGIAPASAIGNSFPVRITADNGFAMNEQNFMLHVVVDDINHVNENQVRIFPNPCINTLNVVNCEHSDIFLFNQQGELLQTVSNAHQNVQLDLSSYSNGMYFIKVVHSTSSFVQKVSLMK